MNILDKSIINFNISGSFSSVVSTIAMMIEASAGDHALLCDDFALAAQLFDNAEKRHQTGNLSKSEFLNILSKFTADLGLALDEERLAQAFNQDPAISAGQWPFLSAMASQDDSKKTDPDDHEKQVKRKIIPAELGNWLINHLRICRIDGMLCYYRHGTYKCDPAPNSDFKKAVKFVIGLCGGSLSASNEIMEYLRECAPDYSKDAEYGPLMIPAANGVVEINPDATEGPAIRLLPFSPNYHLIGGVTVPYVSGAHSDLLDKTLDTYADGDPQILEQIKQLVALSLLNSKRFKGMVRKFPVLFGEPRCGKSHLLNMITNMFGKDQVSTLPPNALSNKFDGSQLRGKRINIADDFGNKLGSNAIASVKKIISGDPILVDIKGLPNETLWTTPVFIGACNELPAITDKGLIERLYPIPFTHCFKEGKDAPEDLNSLEILTALFSLGVDTVCKIFKNSKESKALLPLSDKARELIAEIKNDSDPLTSYVTYLRDSRPENPSPAEELCTYPSTQIAHEKFCQWFRSSRITGNTPSLKKFNKAMCRAFGLGVYVTSVFDETNRRISVRKFRLKTEKK